MIRALLSTATFLAIAAIAAPEAPRTDSPAAARTAADTSMRKLEGVAITENESGGLSAIVGFDI